MTSLNGKYRWTGKFKDLRKDYGQDCVKQLRFLENTEKKIARLRNHIVFTLRCKEENIIPPSLKVKCPIETASARTIVNRARIGLLRERLRVSNNKLNDLRKTKVESESRLFDKLPSDRCDVITAHLTRVRELEHKQTKWRHAEKLKRWMDRKNTIAEEEGSNNKEKWVRNLSSKSLTQSETSLLAKGLNFAVTPDKIPVNEFILATEQATWKLPQEEGDTLRAEITGLLKSAKLPPSNLCKEERKAVKELGKDKSILILPADKGKATVVIDVKTYEGVTRLTQIDQIDQIDLIYPNRF